MATLKCSVHIVFRKTNPGNFSIETIYDTIINYWNSTPNYKLAINRIQLNKNYDWLVFLKCFINAIFGKYNLVHITGGCNYMVMAFPFTKRILTVHDLYYLKGRGNNKGWFYKLFFYTLPLMFSHEIVAVSNRTKMDIINLFPRVANKVTIIHNPLCISTKHAKSIASNWIPKNPLQLLQIGSKPLKNYERLLKATADLPVNYTFIHGKTAEINKLLKEYNLTGRAQLKTQISQEELIQCYQDADLLFFASLWEGFGLPLLEAQALNLPIITSNMEPMKSLAPWSILVNPESTSEIREAVIHFIKKGVPADMLQQAAESTKAYGVDAIAKKYFELYCT